MNAHTTLAELAVTHPSAARVFYERGLDFCCGGRRALDDACRERGLDADDVLAAIESDEAKAAPAVQWNAQPLAALVDHIVTTYHARLRNDLPVLIAMARKVEARHADKPECPKGLLDELIELHADVLDHIEKEEQILFPVIVRGMGARASGPVHAMEVEHEHHAEHLARLRALTGDFIAPSSACNTWRALYLGLHQLERELIEHVHLENNVLFPRALAE